MALIGLCITAAIKDRISIFLYKLNTFTDLPTPFSNYQNKIVQLFEDSPRRISISQDGKFAETHLHLIR